MIREDETHNDAGILDTIFRLVPSEGGRAHRPRNYQRGSWEKSNLADQQNYVASTV